MLFFFFFKLFLKTERLKHQTFGIIRAKIGLGRNFARLENKPDIVVPGMRSLHHRPNFTVWQSGKMLGKQRAFVGQHLQIFDAPTPITTPSSDCFFFFALSTREVENSLLKCLHDKSEADFEPTTLINKGGNGKVGLDYTLADRILLPDRLLN